MTSQSVVLCTSLYISVYSVHINVHPVHTAVYSALYRLSVYHLKITCNMYVHVQCTYLYT